MADHLLPSRGYFYNGAINEGVVHLKPMTTKDEKLLFSARGNLVQAADRIMKRCVDMGNFPVEDLLSVDRFAILLALRAENIDSQYRFRLTCEQCSFNFNHVVNIPGLQVSYLDDEITEPIVVTLPLSGKVVGWRFQRGKDEDQVTRYLANLQSKGMSDDVGYLYRLAKSIVTVDGENVKTTTDAVKFLEDLPLKDTHTLRDSISEHSFGVDTEIGVECPRCSAERSYFIPFGVEFFFPRRLPT